MGIVGFFHIFIEMLEILWCHFPTCWIKMMQHITSGNICISSDSMFQSFEIQVSGCLNDFGLECFIRRNILVEDPFFFCMINSCIRCIPRGATPRNVWNWSWIFWGYERDVGNRPRLEWMEEALEFSSTCIWRIVAKVGMPSMDVRVGCGKALTIDLMESGILYGKETF